MARKSGKKGANGKNYDVMNPEEANPNAKKTGKQIAQFAKKLAKAIGKLVKKLVELLIKCGPIGWIILAVLVVVVIVVAFLSMPGMMRDKFLNLFKINWDWLNSGAVSKLKDQDIVDVANYIEEMGYNLIGDGFVTPVIGAQATDKYKSVDELEEENGYIYKEDENGVYHLYDENNQIVSISYYDLTGKLVDNTTGEPVNGETFTDKYGVMRVTTTDGKNKVVLPYTDSEDENGLPILTKEGQDEFYKNNDQKQQEQKEYLKNFNLIRSYLLSNYRIYTLKNDDEESLRAIYDSLQRSYGGNQDAWTKGLLKIYMAKKGLATGRWSGECNLFEHFEMNEKTLSLKVGWFNNAMDYSIEGWSPRYGMGLDFLLSLHLGTNAPDLVYAMLQNFDTEVQVYLDESGEAKVIGSYVDPIFYNKKLAEGQVVEPSDGYVTFDTLNDAIGDESALAGLIVNDTAVLQGLNNLGLSKKVCQGLLRTLDGLESPVNCERTGESYVIENVSDGYERAKLLGFIPAWDKSVNYLTEYGITEEVDPEVYSDIGSYDTSEYEGESGKLRDFNMEHLTMSLGTQSEDLKNDNFTLLEEEARSSGFDGELSSPIKTEFLACVSDEWGVNIPKTDQDTWYNR